MNPNKNLIEPKPYMNPTKNLIEPKPFMNPTNHVRFRFYQVFIGIHVV
jgi:hypothetical protein